MSVPVNARTENKLEVCVKAHDLCCYTLQITANDKTFTPDYQKSLTDKIDALAIQIYTDVWTANNIMVKTTEDYNERKMLQERAARSCNNLLALIDIAKKIFHLSSKRVFFWGGKAVETRNLIRAWKDSDRKRYSK